MFNRERNKFLEKRREKNVGKRRYRAPSLSTHRTFHSFRFLENGKYLAFAQHHRLPVLLCFNCSSPYTRTTLSPVELFLHLLFFGAMWKSLKFFRLRAATQKIQFKLDRPNTLCVHGNWQPKLCNEIAKEIAVTAAEWRETLKHQPKIVNSFSLALASPRIEIPMC